MSKTKKIILCIAAVVIIALLAVAFYTNAELLTVPCHGCPTDGSVCESCGGDGRVIGSLWAFLPPIIAIGLALITKEVFSSLFIGILSGAIISSGFSFAKTFDIVLNDGLISAVSGTAGIFIFLVELGIIVALINKAGGSAAFGR